MELIPRLIAKVHFNGLKLSCSQLLVLFRGLDLLARDFESLAGDWGGARYESTLLEKLRSLGIWRAIASLNDKNYEMPSAVAAVTILVEPE